jgi:hypothetical protein
MNLPWNELHTMDREQLRSLGLGEYSGLMLIPVAAYDAIPLGFALTSINNKTRAHRPYPRLPSGEVDWEAVKADGGEYTDDDHRFGFLAYGVRGAP